VVNTGKYGRHRVEVPLRHRVKLVVVTARTPQGQPQECRTRGVDHRRQLILTLQCRVVGVLALDLIPSTGNEESRCSLSPDRVPGELLEDEAVVRQVAIERVDDPVPIVVGVRSRRVHLEAVGVGILDRVEPVLSPPLAVAGTREGLIDELRPRILSPVPDEGLDPRRRRQQAVQIEVQASDQTHAVRCGRRSQSLFLQSPENEGING